MSILHLLATVGLLVVVAATDPITSPSPGFIITGGENSYERTYGARGRVTEKAEVFNPLSGRSCPLPDLSKGIKNHSHCGNLLCNLQSCLKMNPTGSFSPASVSLLQERMAHICWSLPGGEGEVMLMGGLSSPTTTEIVSADSSSTKPSWDLKFRTWYACGVEVDDTFIVTGGHDYSAPDRALNSVVRYNSQGVSEVLSSLTVRRAGHACTSYLNDNGQRVVLVTGGYNLGASVLDSTELMVDFNSWRPAANLPSARPGLRAASLDNKVFLFGGEYDIEGEVSFLDSILVFLFGGVHSSESPLDSILFYNPDSDEWQPAGNMIVPRWNHAVAVFPDVSQLCP